MKFPFNDKLNFDEVYCVSESQNTECNNKEDIDPNNKQKIFLICKPSKFVLNNTSPTKMFDKNSNIFKKNLKSIYHSYFL